MKRNFKVGDRVRIRQFDDMKKEFGCDSCGDIKCSPMFVDLMSHLCGRTATITEIYHLLGEERVRLDFDDKSGNIDWNYSADMLEPINNETIVIYRKDNEVIALDKSTGKKAVAKCNPDDTFDFKVGAKLALERLTAPQLLNTKICIVKSTHENFTVGKIYEIEDGLIRCNRGDEWPMGRRFHSIEDVKAYFSRDKYPCHFDMSSPIEFVEVVE